MRLSMERFPIRQAELRLSGTPNALNKHSAYAYVGVRRGVTINHDPVKRGFGSEILERSIPEMLQGSFNRTFHPDGIECVIEFSIEGSSQPSC